MESRPERVALRSDRVGCSDIWLFCRYEYCGRVSAWCWNCDGTGGGPSTPLSSFAALGMTNGRVCMTSLIVASSGLWEHYATAGPILEGLFGGTPLVWVTRPNGLEKPAFYHGPLPSAAPVSVPHVDVS